MEFIIYNLYINVYHDYEIGAFFAYLEIALN